MSGFYDRFSLTAERFADRTAIEVQRRAGLESWTYRRLRDQAESMAANLSRRGLAAGDRCALLAENDADWCAAYLGILRLGAVPVPLDTTYNSQQIAKLITDCGARQIVVSPKFQGEVERARPEIEAELSVIPLDRNAGGEPRRTDSAHGEPAAVQPDDIAVILYTSGTTSDPKGVVLTHANILAEIDAALHVVDLKGEDAILGVLPLFHALAQLANLLIPLTIGARIVFLESLNSADLMRALQERNISAFCCVPQFFYLIHQRVLEQVARSSGPRRLVFRWMLAGAGFLRERLGINLGPRLFGRVHRALGPRMRLLVTGGSRFDPGIGRDLYRLGFNILQAYGLTETSGAATVLRPGDRHVGSVGQALPGVEVKIVPSDAVVDPVAAADDSAQKIGEVLVRGPVVSAGYYKRPDVNAVSFRDGWLYTGDLGYLDPAGRLYITGRAKDVIVLGSGKNIYPEEIEAHYMRSDYIKELCVIGRALPGAPTSERLHAVVVPDFEVLRERKMFNSREIVRWEIETLSAKLPGHKRILSYDVVTDDLPRTTTRKLKRFEIERRLDAQESSGELEVARRPEAEPDDPAWTADPHVIRTLEILRGLVQARNPILRSSNLELDLGLDSMDRVELLAAMEAHFALSVPDELAHGIHTVGELVESMRPETEETVGGRTGADFDPWRRILEDLPDDDPAVEPARVERPVWTFLMFLLVKLMFAFAWLFLGLRVHGREHLPERGPFLISPNHQSYLDGFLLAAVLPYRIVRSMFYVGASEYFATPFRAWVARMIHVVPVDPDSNLVHAMRAGAEGLRRGKILILFPEGERSIDSELKTFKKGAAILSLKTAAPIVPVAIDGLHEFWPRARRPRLSRLLPFSGARVRFRFGPPLQPEAGENQTDSDYTALTSRLRRAVETLLTGLRDTGRIGPGVERGQV